MSTKVVCGVIFVLFCVLQFGYAIQCYRCDSESSCRNAKKYECNQFYANETVRYLDAYFQNVELNKTSPNFICMRHDIKFPSSTSKVKYKGCLYSNMNSCSYSFRPLYQQQSTVFTCINCSDRNGCNPADRKTVSAVTAIALPLVVVLIYKHFIA